MRRLTSYRLDGTVLYGLGVTPDVALASRPEQVDGASSELDRVLAAAAAKTGALASDSAR